jgi:hypothetical protein
VPRFLSANLMVMSAFHERELSVSPSEEELRLRGLSNGTS